MHRRHFLSLSLAPVLMAAGVAKSLRGQLRQTEGGAATLELADKRNIALAGDEPTIGVLNDPRLKDADFEVMGHFDGAARFEIDKIHTRSLFAHKDGKRLMVTYWCEICYIRTYTPGDCWCCQEWTTLDLREPGTPERVP